MIKVGTTEVTNIHLAGWEVQRAYVGGDLVFQAQKPSRLPAGYTEVEWIQASTVASYIDTKKGVNNSDFIVKFQIPEVSGFYTSSASSCVVYSSKFQIFKKGNNSTFFMWLFSSSSTSYSSYILADNVIKL